MESQHVIQPQGISESKGVDNSQPTGSLNSPSFADMFAVQEYFGMEDLTMFFQKEIERLNFVKDFLKSQGISSKGEALGILRQIERKLPPTPQGFTRLQAIHNYVKTLAHLQEANQMKEALEK
jgi:hypothetical protein